MVNVDDIESLRNGMPEPANYSSSKHGIKFDRNALHGCKLGIFEAVEGQMVWKVGCKRCVVSR